MIDALLEAGCEPRFAARFASLQEEIDRAASETDLNASPSQLEAGNSRKGKFRWNGLTIAIENPKGSVRTKYRGDGTSWSRTMAHTYGYFLGTEGSDGDHLDVFVGPNPDSDEVFVINQNKRDGSHDEHKCLIGFDTEEEAKAGYLASYPPDWTGLGSIFATSVDKFKEWLDQGDTREPLVEFTMRQHPQYLIRQIADKWFNEDGTPKNRAMRKTIIWDAMETYKIPLYDAAYLVEQAILSRGAKVDSAYWDQVAKLDKPETPLSRVQQVTSGEIRGLAKVTPDLIRNAVKLWNRMAEKRKAAFAFCATGDGGGIDPTCSPEESGGGGEKLSGDRITKPHPATGTGETRQIAGKMTSEKLAIGAALRQKWDGIDRKEWDARVSKLAEHVPDKGLKQLRKTLANRMDSLEKASKTLLGLKPQVKDLDATIYAVDEAREKIGKR